LPSRIGSNPSPVVAPTTPPVSRPVAPGAVAPATPVDRFDPTAAAVSGIETIFTPGDQAKKTELASIDQVISARKADPKTYPPGENPYRIEYAIYNMTDHDVIAKLIDASKAGVQVQVLIEAAQIGPDKPFNTVVDELTKGGFSHAETQKGLTEEQRKTTQVIEIDLPGSGLFHFKSRYFTWPDPATGLQQETLLTGSHNPQNTAHKNDESLHKITDPRLVHRYLEAFHNLRDDKPIANNWEENQPVNVLFTSPTASGPRPVDRIFEMIDQEKEMIFLTLFELRSLVNSKGEKIADKLIAAHERGVKVVLVTDNKGSIHDPTDDALKAAGIPVYEYTNPTTERTAMHLKSALFGVTDMKVVTDTGNWTLATMGTASGHSKNAESLLFVDSGKYDQNHTGERYLGEFLRVLRKYDDQNTPDRKPVEELVSELQALPGWPTVDVSFDAVARQLDPGQKLVLSGERIPGGSLTFESDPASGLFSTPSPVALPLGLKLDYAVGPQGAPGPASMVVIDPTQTPDTDRLDVQVP
jgi:hypothetical protein